MPQRIEDTFHAEELADLDKFCSIKKAGWRNNSAMFLAFAIVTLLAPALCQGT